MKEPRLTPATDTSSDMDAKDRARTKRSAYYSKVELPVLAPPRNSGAITQTKEAAGDSPQGRICSNPSTFILGGLDDVQAIDSSTFVRRWHELGEAPPGSDSEPGSDTEVSLRPGEVCPSLDNLESAPERPNKATAGTEQSCAQESHGNNSPVCNDEEPEYHEAQWPGTRVQQLQDHEVLEKQVQVMRCQTAPEAVELKGPTMHATQCCPSAYSIVLSLINMIPFLGLGYFFYIDITKLVTVLKPLSKAAGISCLRGVIEMLRGGVCQFNCPTSLNYWAYIMANYPCLWAFLMVGPLFLVVHLTKEFLDSAQGCWKSFTTPAHEGQGKKDQGHINPPESKYKPNQERMIPVTQRAVSKVIRVGGRSDITLAELVLLDQLESQGGLGRKTIQILDGVRDVVLEDVVGKLDSRRMFFRNELREMRMHWEREQKKEQEREGSK